MKSMPRPSVMIVAALLFCGAAFAQRDSSNTEVIDFAQHAVARTLNFKQGDAAGLQRARDDFSQQGWNEFIKTMNGFLDAMGAPTFNSSFVASDRPQITEEKKGLLRVTIPGKLTQTQNQSRTVYDPLVIDLLIDQKQMKIEHMEQIYKPRQPRE
jgi:hypothetical protein